MVKPILFVLNPGFPDPAVGPGRFYCPDSAAVMGLLAYYPALRDRLDVRMVDFARPRAAVIAEVGEERQACPVLVLPPGHPAPPDAQRAPNGRAHFTGAAAIAAFLGQWAGVPAPHP